MAPTPEQHAVEVILFQSRPNEGDPCCVCAEPCDGYHGLPFFNGDLVSNDWPGDWGNKACCRRCYEAHERGELQCFDDVYRGYLDSIGMMSDGAGI